MSIVDYTGPGLYPPILVDLINASWQQGLDKQALFETKIANATSGWLDTATAPTVTPSTVGVPTVVEPTVTIPSSASVADVVTTYDTQYNALVSLLATKFADFRAAHYPDSDTNTQALEAWLADAMANPDQVLPTALANVIWEDDRSRIIADAVQASEDAVAFWANKGHPLPGGAEASAVLQVQKARQMELAKSSRNVATKTFELAYDKIKFVISTVAATQQAALAASLDYIKALAVGPDIASRLTSTAYDAETKLVAAAGAFFNARSDAAKVSLTAAQFNAQSAQSAAEKNQASELAMIQARLEAMLSEAKALAQMSASLFNNLHASASVGATDSVSTSL